jgi:hypothetical protein
MAIIVEHLMHNLVSVYLSDDGALAFVGIFTANVKDSS